MAAVTAGTFVAKDKTRTPRAPITELTFKLKGDPEPIPVNLVGTPNKGNGVRGTLDLGQATKVFYPLSNEQEIEALLKYGDGTSDPLAFLESEPAPISIGS